MAVTSHFLLASFPAWGHLRPLTVLACKIIQQRHDIGITLFLAAPYLQQVEREIEISLRNVTQKERIKVIDILEKEEDLLVASDMSKFFIAVEKAFERNYDSIFNTHSITCQSTGKIHDFSGWPNPNVVVADMVLGIYPYVRSRSPSARIFLFHSTNLTPARKPIIDLLNGKGVHPAFENLNVGGRAHSQLSGKELTELVEKIILPTNGAIFDIPGMPSIYDYELIPQGSFMDNASLVHSFNRIISFLRNADGVVSASSRVYEAASQDVYRKYLSSSKRDFYAVGPLLSLPITPSTDSRPDGTVSSDSQFKDFLNHTMAKHGKHSLLYISFGTVFRPPVEYLSKFIDILLDMEFPFILASGPIRAVVPEDFKEKIKDSNLGLLARWCPQQLILNHEATGWFLTHCGQNSVMEALCAGVPMITWPQDFDQPINAIQLSQVHNVAYELHEVRTGEHGLKPLLRGVKPRGGLEAVEAEAKDVLQAARGADGALKRRNIQAMAQKLKVTWEPDGDASSELNRFLEKERQFPTLAAA